MSTSPRPKPAIDTVDGADVPAWVAWVSVAGVVGVSWYVASWAAAGALTPGYEPTRQAISELYAIGAPTLPRALVASSLALSGAALVAFGFALDRGLPGRGRAGPLAAGVSGVMTVAVVAAPCTAGCPGAGASVTDAAHSIIAGVGYLALVLAPLLVARRVRQEAPAFAAWSVVLGGVALLGFVLRATGIADDVAGVQQRVFNTVADAWYVVAALLLIRARQRAVRRSGRG